ncbi:hypothetical protein [Actinosynnema sp. NPDC023587]|uniref:hypothetical protein n=1 Tax=Actinosynnema sp. NPDC023587 TaxID=3154695 RepID=UPI0033E2EF67
MPGSPLRDAIADALNQDSPQDVIDDVKSAVIAEIENLDPAVQIKKTDYFNHSFAPDLVLTWKTAARKEETRELYVRYSLGSSQAAGDVDILGKGGPIFFSLNSSNDDEEFAGSIREELMRAPRSLFTNAPAIDRITLDAETEEPQHRDSPAPPLLNLFRRNVVRGGRGLIVANVAERLERSTSTDVEEDFLYVDRFTEAVSGIFDEAATLRLRRAADLVKIALSGEVSILDRPDDGDDGVATISGKLDDTELRALLPFLLDRGQSIDDVRFWQHLGQMLTLAQLENMASTLSDHDLTPLAQANLPAWRAAKAVLSFNADALEEEGYQGPRWRMHGGSLCASAGAWNIHFASDLRRGLRSREDSTLPRWEKVLPSVQSFSVSKVELQGITRRISIAADAEAAVNVLGDVVSVQGNIDDTFFVRSVEVRPAGEESADVNLDFSTLMATGANVPVDYLTRASLGVLGHRYPVSPADMATLLGETQADAGT